MSITVATYNILSPYHAILYNSPEGFTALPDGSKVSNWDERGPKVIANLKAANFDIACLQEVGSEQAKFLHEKFKTCGFALVVSDFPEGSDGGPIFKNAALYNTDRFRLIDQHELVAQPISNMYFTKAAMAILEHKDSGQKLGAISVHLKGFNPYETNEEKLHAARQPGFDQLKLHMADAEQLAAQHGCNSVLIAGDFNEGARPDWPSNRVGVIESNGYHHDGNLEPTELVSGWGKFASGQGNSKSPSKIDWIFVKSRVLKRMNITIPHKGASDHLPTFSQFQL